MSNTLIESLPRPHEILALLPNPYSSTIQRYRKQAQSILRGVGRALIVGPCSIHSYDDALRYAEKLLTLETDMMVIMRVFVQKPRTVTGWKGFVYDPDLNGSGHLEKGLLLTRQLLLELTSRGVPLAMEFLDPLLTPYFEDLITWGFIGARTVESPLHRELVSALSLPVGFKNRTDGDVQIALNAMEAARHPQIFFGMGPDGAISRIQSSGNHDTHLVLRGSTRSPNYKRRDPFGQAKIMIDCSHGNAGGNPLNQIEVFRYIVEENHPQVIGMMLESNLAPSLIDPGLTWEETEALIHCACKAALHL